VKQFLKFAFLSGLGWVCDFTTFTVLVKIAGLSPFLANLVSSYVGVTFVWFTSLKTVFQRRTNGSGTFLVAYWCYQFVSIMAYSQVLHITADGLAVAYLTTANSGVAAKLLITPFNLITNYLFMKLLTRFMQKEQPHHA
jgi:putative flippase GtrA